MNDLAPHEAHVLAEEAREKGDFLSSLNYLNQAIVAYLKEDNYAGFIGVLQSRILTYKHYFLSTKESTFARLAQNDAELSLSLAEQKKIISLLGSCYFRLGEVANLFNDYPLAVNNFMLALEHFQGTDAERGDYRYHLGEAVARTGEKDEGIKIMLTGLKEIQDNASQVDPFLAHVWESGCYLRLAEALKDEDYQRTLAFLEKAKDIIDADPKLVIRKKHYEKVAASLNPHDKTI